MERRNGRFRFQLQFYAGERRALHRLAYVITRYLENEKTLRKVRWNLDIDPLDCL